MTIPSRLTFVLGVLALLILHHTVRPTLAWRVEVDWQLIALVLVALRSRPGVAAVIGFLLGLVMDALVPAAFGAGALALTLVGYAAARFRTGFFGESVLVGAAIIGLGKVVADLAVIFAEGRLRGAGLLAQGALWTPLSALLTAAVGAVVLYIGRSTPRRPVR